MARLVSTTFGRKGKTESGIVIVKHKFMHYLSTCKYFLNKLVQMEWHEFSQFYFHIIRIWTRKPIKLLAML